jgi:hypothetical protein
MEVHLSLLLSLIRVGTRNRRPMNFPLLDAAGHTQRSLPISRHCCDIRPPPMKFARPLDHPQSTQLATVTLGRLITRSRFPLYRI